MPSGSSSRGEPQPGPLKPCQHLGQIGEREKALGRGPRRAASSLAGCSVLVSKGSNHSIQGPIGLWSGMLTSILTSHRTLQDLGSRFLCWGSPKCGRSPEGPGLCLLSVAHLEGKWRGAGLEVIGLI